MFGLDVPATARATARLDVVAHVKQMRLEVEVSHLDAVFL